MFELFVRNVLFEITFLNSLGIIYLFTTIFNTILIITLNLYYFLAMDQHFKYYFNKL